MLIPVIQTLDKRTILTYPSLPDFKLEMDFNPIIDKFRLKGKFCLLHWQAKPLRERRWGIYDSENDEYFSRESQQVEIKSIPILLQIDESTVKTVPTAVLYFPNSSVLQEDYLSLVSL